MKNTLLIRPLIIMTLLTVAVDLSLLAPGCTKNTACLPPSAAPSVAGSRLDLHQVNDLTESIADEEKEPFETALMPEQAKGGVTYKGGTIPLLVCPCDSGKCFNNFIAKRP